MNTVLILPMRNGNLNLRQFFWLKLCILFLSYLWGMETKQGRGFPSPLRAEFLSYLWGMETWHKGSSYWGRFLVLILPMRNGNTGFNLFLLYYTTVRSYPTYEEWKPKTPKAPRLDFSPFLSYLWGMETKIYGINH